MTTEKSDGMIVCICESSTDVDRKSTTYEGDSEDIYLLRPGERSEAWLLVSPFGVCHVYSVKLANQCASFLPAQ